MNTVPLPLKQCPLPNASAETLANDYHPLVSRAQLKPHNWTGGSQLSRSSGQGAIPGNTVHILPEPIIWAPFEALAVIPSLQASSTYARNSEYLYFSSSAEPLAPSDKNTWKNINISSACLRDGRPSSLSQCRDRTHCPMFSAQLSSQWVSEQLLSGLIPTGTPHPGMRRTVVYQLQKPYARTAYHSGVLMALATAALPPSHVNFPLDC
ncbi:hypothetical protein BDV93DRAFT_312847 [Ceratobasidium sp. AG-I]|nr:hypothetical protein BDV93DRAFT_312847 [Ceratobasidium sp. AG-I]